MAGDPSPSPSPDRSDRGVDRRPSNRSLDRPDRSGRDTIGLEQIVRRCLDRHADAGGFDGPSLTILGVNRDATDVLVRGLGDPEKAVVGFVLPQRHSAMVVLANSVVATPPQRSHRAGAIAIGVDRVGAVSSMLATDDELIETDEPQGWLIDACLRAVGRPTPATDISPLAYPIAIWMDRLMVAILNAPAGAPLQWLDAVRLCPVPRRWQSSDPVDLGVTLASTTTSWAALRTATVHGRRAPAGVTAEQAAWMDDAMFARWCLGGYPDLAGLRGDVEFLAPAEVAEQVEVTLRSAWSTFSG